MRQIRNIEIFKCELLKRSFRSIPIDIMHVPLVFVSKLLIDS